MVEPELRQIVAGAASERDRIRKNLLIVGVLTSALRPLRIVPVIVGGAAVEFYTLGGYATRDIDLVCADRQKALDILQELGFKQEASLRHWYHEDLDVAIEIPDETLAGSMDRVAVVEVAGLEANVIAVEDLIVDRLNAYRYWQSAEDRRWALRLIELHREDIDLPYLQQRAEEEGTSDELAELWGSNG